MKIESVTESGYSHILYDNLNQSSKDYIRRENNSVVSENKNKISKVQLNNS